MRSLRSRLWLLWGLALAASLGVGFLLIQLYQTTTRAQVGRAEALVTRACDTIRDRYGFYVAGWQGDGADANDAGFQQDLLPVVKAGLAREPGIEGGIWSATAGSLAYAIPGALGTGTPAALPAAELPNIQAVNRDALQAEQTVLRTTATSAQTLLLAACPLDGPYGGLTAWTMTRVQRAQGYDSLRIGLGLLLVLVLGIAGWVTWLTALWGRHVRGIETALALHDIEDLPLLPRTGERELDRIVTALNDAGRRLAQAHAKSADMAAQMAASERLAALGRVAAGVAHEIRNPMAAMRLRAENALAGDTVRHRPALEASLGQIARVDRLVGELLAMTQRRSPAPQTISLPPFLDSVAAEHRDQAAASGVDLVTEGRAQTACFDPALIGRALDNLLLNAIQHTPRGGAVTMRAEDHGGLVRITVADSGAGVDPAVRARLFEPFVTGRADGTGLGLAIAREMVEAHGGRLSLADADGPGARFIVELPRGTPCQPS
jgi:signal transduction histidine kinase